MLGPWLGRDPAEDIMGTRTERSYGLNGYTDIQVPDYPDLGTIEETTQRLQDNVVRLCVSNLFGAALMAALSGNRDEVHSILRGEVGA